MINMKGEITDILRRDSDPATASCEDRRPCRAAARKRLRGRLKIRDTREPVGHGSHESLRHGELGGTHLGGGGPGKRKTEFKLEFWPSWRERKIRPWAAKENQGVEAGGKLVVL